jgi:hypothetical protein
MDKITRSLLDSFVKEEALSPKDDAEAFEHFGNYTVLSSEYSEQFDITDIHAGSGSDTGLDGVAILVNGTLVTDTQEIDDLLSTNRYLDVTFIFVQSKASSHFDIAEFGVFAFGVVDFFSEKPSLVRNEAIDAFSRLQEYIFSKSVHMTRGKPECKLFYVTTGKWQSDLNFTARIEAARKDLEQLNLFEEVEITPIDADRLHRMYNSSKNKVQTEIQFQNKITLPDITGVQQAYLGVLPAEEYLKLITDGSGSIRKSLFYDNVRDYQGNNEVNKEIAQTLSSEHQDRFAILNNGVTVVAKSVQPVGNKFLIEDYQIVNGCQTSHVIFLNQDSISEPIFIPVKIIVSTDEEVVNSVIKANNRQTAVGIEDLESLSNFQKKLEAYYQAIAAPNKLYYERRSRQYNDVAGIEKVRIVTLPYQLRYFASMFLDEPHRAGRYYGTLLQLIGKKVFLSSHDPISYYTSAFANYKLDTLFRNGSMDSKYRMYRYHLLMILRYQLGGKDMPALVANKIKSYCDRILTNLHDPQKASVAFQAAAGVIDSLTTGSETRDVVKTQSFTDQVLGELKR